MKYVYFFGAGKADGTGDMRDLLGGKGAGLAEMTRIGLPVPAGFTITTETCDYFLTHGRKYPSELRGEVAKSITQLEKLTGKKLGDAKDPLLVSVRSGSARSMPGMMETILNLGLNDRAVQGLAHATKNERFAYDAYRRFVQMYSSVVIGLPKEDLEHRLRAMKQSLGVKDDTEVSAEGWKRLVGEYKAYFKEKTGKDFPDDPQEQLWGAIGAVFDSWMGEKAVTYRRVEKITGLLGTAVNVVQMVFGNTGDRFRHRSLLHARPFDRRKDFLRRFPVERAGRRRGRRNPHADALERNGQADAEGLSATRKSAPDARETLSRHAGPGIHGRERQALHAANAHRQALAVGRFSNRRGHGEREADQS